MRQRGVDLFSSQTASIRDSIAEPRHIGIGQRGLTIVALAAALGCHSAAYTVATLKNSYDYHLARYSEACPPAPATAPSWCPAYYQRLLQAKKHLDEAAEAVHAGGGLPLQMSQIRADAKGLK